MSGIGYSQSWRDSLKTLKEIRKKEGHKHRRLSTSAAELYKDSKFVIIQCNDARGNGLLEGVRDSNFLRERHHRILTNLGNYHWRFEDVKTAVSDNSCGAYGLTFIFQECLKNDVLGKKFKTDFAKLYHLFFNEDGKEVIETIQNSLVNGLSSEMVRKISFVINLMHEYEQDESLNHNKFNSLKDIKISRCTGDKKLVASNKLKTDRKDSEDNINKLLSFYDQIKLSNNPKNRQWQIGKIREWIEDHREDPTAEDIIMMLRYPKNDYLYPNQDDINAFGNQSRGMRSVIALGKILFKDAFLLEESVTPAETLPIIKASELFANKEEMLLKQMMLEILFGSDKAIEAEYIDVLTHQLGLDEKDDRIQHKEDGGAIIKLKDEDRGNRSLLLQDLIGICSAKSKVTEQDIRSFIRALCEQDFATINHYIRQENKYDIFSIIADYLGAKKRMGYEISEVNIPQSAEQSIKNILGDHGEQVVINRKAPQTIKNKLAQIKHDNKYHPTNDDLINDIDLVRGLVESMITENQLGDQANNYGHFAIKLNEFHYELSHNKYNKYKLKPNPLTKYINKITPISNIGHDELNDEKRKEQITNIIQDYIKEEETIKHKGPKVLKPYEHNKYQHKKLKPKLKLVPSNKQKQPQRKSRENKNEDGEHKQLPQLQNQASYLSTQSEDEKNLCLLINLIEAGCVLTPALKTTLETQKNVLDEFKSNQLSEVKKQVNADVKNEIAPIEYYGIGAIGDEMCYKNGSWHSKITGIFNPKLKEQDVKVGDIICIKSGDPSENGKMAAISLVRNEGIKKYDNKNPPTVTIQHVGNYIVGIAQDIKPLAWECRNGIYNLKIDNNLSEDFKNSLKKAGWIGGKNQENKESKDNKENENENVKTNNPPIIEQEITKEKLTKQEEKGKVNGS